MTRIADRNRILERTVELAAPHQAKALGEKLKSLGGRVFKYFLSRLSGQSPNPEYDSDEVFQRYLLRVLGSLPKLKDAARENWFWTVARTVFLDYVTRDLGKLKREQSLEVGEEEDSLPIELVLGVAVIEDFDDFRHWNPEAVDNLMLRCIEKLSPRLREFLILDLVERLPKEEVVARMGLERPSFAANKARALKKLRALIVEELAQQASGR